MSAKLRKNHPFKGLPKERGIFEAAKSFARRVGHLVNEDYFTEAVIKGLKEGELKLTVEGEAVVFIADPRPKKLSYDDLLAEVESLRIQMGIPQE